jgi:hypothetical protein
MGVVDYWISMPLPLFWLYFVRGRQIISLPYTVAMWFVLLGSLVSTFAAPAPLNGLIVILKEVYIFFWFVTLTAVFSQFNARDFRRIMLVWTGIVLLHGFLIVAQFLSPDLWRFTTALVGRSTDFDIYRPAGLFLNPNTAAFFQLVGFVPLLLANLSKKVTMILGILLFITMVSPGSMGATLAFIVGLMVAVAAILVSGGYLVPIIKIFVQLVIVISILAGLLYFAINQHEGYQTHFNKILFGRAERSSGGRFDLWQRGIDVFLDRGILLWGIGPENFRKVDGKDKQLHNDLLAFAVERGLLGTLGLVLFGTLAVSRATYMLLIYFKYPHRARLAVAVFLAVFVATLVESLTHQVFHTRQLWLALALQEAILFKMTTSESGLEPTTHTLNELPRPGHEFVVQRDVTGG